MGFLQDLHVLGALQAWTSTCALSDQGTGWHAGVQETHVSVCSTRSQGRMPSSGEQGLAACWLGQNRAASLLNGGPC
jgi:hypothetical protein